MIAAAISRGGVPIRLTAERWSHIVEEHCELAGLREEVMQTVADAESVHLGREGELMAMRQLGVERSIVVVYRENSARDGFIITAFLTSRPDRVSRRPQSWPHKTS